MKSIFYTLITLFALGVLVSSYRGSAGSRANAAETATLPPTAGAVTGDLVIDFMGAQRGYVEPCG